VDTFLETAKSPFISAKFRRGALRNDFRKNNMKSETVFNHPKLGDDARVSAIHPEMEKKTDITRKPDG
jgi:hypothetical protein